MSKKNTPKTNPTRRTYEAVTRWAAEHHLEVQEYSPARGCFIMNGKHKHASVRISGAEVRVGVGNQTVIWTPGMSVQPVIDLMAA